MRKSWPITIDCPNCAAKLERALQKLPGVAHVSVNYVQKRFTLEAADGDFDAVLTSVLAKTAEIEPDTVIHAAGEGHARHEHHHAHEHCACGHEHHHGHEHCGCGHEHHHDHEHCACGHEHHHDHEHHHSHHHGHNHAHGASGGRAFFVRMGLTAALLAMALLIGAPVLRPVLFVAAYLCAGYDVLRTAIRNILRGQIFDENFLMTAASLGALIMGEGAEAVAVMALYQIGEYFQDKAVDKSRESITALMDVRPDRATVLRDGQFTDVNPQDVEIGETIRVLPGEKIPLDGVVTSGATAIDTAALTGESLPRDVEPGDSVLSGCVNGHGVIEMRVTAAYGQSTVAKILELVETSGEQKAKTERFITRFARVYTPIVCLAALLLAAVPGIITNDWQKWIYQALTFLVISCPCALVISVPLAYFAGIGAASRRGVLIKGANYLEMLSGLTTVALDKTGTLTRGAFTVTEIHPVDVDAAELLRLAAHAESISSHPISRSLQGAYGQEIDASAVRDGVEAPGRGVSARVGERLVHAGNARWMAEKGIDAPETDEIGTIVHVALDGTYAGRIVISDEMKPTTAAAISQLKAEGVAELVMLTGDGEAAAQSVARQIGLTDVRSRLLPGDKVAALESLLGEGKRVAFAGDGVNDAPVLRRADVGIAMGALGSDAAIEAADVVLMSGDLTALPQAIRLSRRTMGVVRQNIAMSLGFKGIIMLLGLFGAANMWLAVFADVGVAFLAILNSCRLNRRA